MSGHGDHGGWPDLLGLAGRRPRAGWFSWPSRYSPPQAGLAFLPLSILTAAMNPQGARLVTRIGARRGLLGGTAAIAAAYRSERTRAAPAGAAADG